MSDNPAPAAFTWDADRGVMVPRHRNLAMRTYTDTEEYRLGVIEERSVKTHNHFFAALHESWENLPERLAEQFPTSEHLRRYALIRAGFHDSQTLVCSSRAEALRIAAFMKPMDEFSVVVARESTVTRYTAKSQSLKAMGREEFQRSKQATLDVVAQLIGITPATLAANARVAA